MITCTVPKPSPIIQSITMLVDLPSGSSLSYAFVGEERVVVDEDIPAALLLNIEDVRICTVTLKSLFSMPFNFTCINEGVEETLTILVSRKILPLMKRMITSQYHSLASLNMAVLSLLAQCFMLVCIPWLYLL